ncbi:MAG: hypothetical protein FJX75_09010 [Armatimonadetes bacterium]|nr:hypothetical protein [Armatimonadota bacterium]
MRRRRLWLGAILVVAIAAAAYGVSARVRRPSARAPTWWRALEVTPERAGDWLTYRYPARCTCLAVRQDVAWLGTMNGWAGRWNLHTGAIGCLPCEGFPLPPDTDPFHEMHVDDAGGVWWYAREHDRVYQLDGKRFRYEGKLPEVAAKTGLFTVTDKAGRKWLEGKVWRQGKWSPEPFPGLPDCVVAEAPVVLDADGNLWAVIVEFHEPEGEIDRHPPFLAETIAVYDGREWQSRSPESIKGNVFLPSLVGDARGRVWTTISKQTYCCERGKWQRVPLGPDWVVDSGCVTFDQTGTLWRWASDAIARFDGRRTDRWGAEQGLVVGPLEYVEEVVPHGSGGALFVTTDRFGRLHDDRVEYVTGRLRLPANPADLVVDRLVREENPEMIEVLREMALPAEMSEAVFRRNAARMLGL